MWLADSTSIDQRQKKNIHGISCKILLNFFLQTRNSLENTLNKLFIIAPPKKTLYPKPSNHIKDNKYKNNSLLNLTSQCHFGSHWNDPVILTLFWFFVVKKLSVYFLVKHSQNLFFIQARNNLLWIKSFIKIMFTVAEKNESWNN